MFPMHMTSTFDSPESSPSSNPEPESQWSRRRLLRAGVATGGLWLAGLVAPLSAAEQAAAAAGSAELVEKMRAQLGATPIVTTKLRDNVTLLTGPGGNVVVLHGADGKVVVDSFVQPAWPKLKAILDGIDASPIKVLIDTHWHFDHADNNANFHGAGAAILAHANTKTRLSQPHDLLGMHFDPWPAAALPTETFTTTHALRLDGEQLALGHFAPAHTDTDLYVHFTKANVLQMGDVFFNGFYPFIDASTGGRIDGMIAGAAHGLTMADAQTKIVPGHGPVGDKASLASYHDMLVTVRERVHKLKTAGKTLAEAQAAKPTADLDAAWGGGRTKSDDFVGFVYSTL